MSNPIITLTTDYGTNDHLVGVVKGVILGILPTATIVDISHHVAPFDLLDAALTIGAAYSYFPPRTVHVVVVDPGVGTARRPLLVGGEHHYFVAPDNGVLTPVLDRDGFDSAREITNQNWMIQAAVSSTFHGRDIFSPAAAHLAAGWDYTLVGPVVPQLVRLTSKSAVVSDKGITGDLIGLDDPFGSLITDITREDFTKLGYVVGDKVPVTINKKVVTLPFGKTFMDVPVGEPLLYIDSRGRVGIAINQGNYSKKFNVEVPGTIHIPTKHTPITTPKSAKH